MGTFKLDECSNARGGIAHGYCSIGGIFLILIPAAENTSGGKQQE